MLPPIEKANAEADMDSDASDDMNDGLVHHLPKCLRNSTCDSNLLDKGNNRNLCNACNPQIRYKENQLQETGKKALTCNQL